LSGRDRVAHVRSQASGEQNEPCGRVVHFVLWKGHPLGIWYSIILPSDSRLKPGVSSGLLRRAETAGLISPGGLAGVGVRAHLQARAKPTHGHRGALAQPACQGCFLRRSRGRVTGRAPDARKTGAANKSSSCTGAHKTPKPAMVPLLDFHEERTRPTMSSTKL
jgi:hypothetical protein